MNPAGPEQVNTESHLHGLLNLYKPVGKSTAFYVYLLRRILGVKKVGHAGTLDPFAEGVVLACIGKGTKLVEELMCLPKAYRTTLMLGVTNETLDTERPFEPVPGAVPPTPQAIHDVLKSMTGTVMQTPPAFSAIRVGGTLSYKLAKRGKAIALTPRPVRIDRIDVVSYEWPKLELNIECGRGTYIRAIARDLGEALGCGACCETLIRTAVGPFHSDAALRMEKLGKDEIRAAVIDLPEVRRLIASPPAGIIPPQIDFRNS